MLKPSPDKYTPLAQASIRALAVPSPSVANGKLLLRGRKNIACYDLTTVANSPTAGAR
ncbi:MAG: hypothetical protein N3B01_08515 [Verrucomicrobiae bacterium]|nr:hypothetical protein [Verrucomicrobiae bacterium]